MFIVRAMSQPHILLLDASGLIHRAYYAGAAKYRADGLPIWAVLGFVQMTYAMLARADADPPTHGAACFDFPGRTFRHKIFPAYKANRPAARRLELEPQLPLIRHAAMALGLAPVEVEGWEADDVLATLAAQAAARGIRVTLVSGDKDLLQTVRDGVIEVIDPTLREHVGTDGKSALIRKRYLATDVKRKFGVPPDLVPDAQALSGDAVDGIPGIDGIGGKMAGRMIARFGGIEPLLKAAGQSGVAIETPTIKRRLRENADAIRLYKKLATMDTAVPGMPSMDSLALHKPEPEHLREMLRVLGCADLHDVLFGGDPGLTMRLPHVPAPLQWWHKAVKAAQTNVALREIPNDPQDGFYKRRLVRGGAWVPGRIWRERERDFVSDKETDFDIVKCEVAGKPVHPLRAWDALARMPISKESFDHLTALGGWARQHAPNSSEANPGKPIDWLKEPLE